MTTQVLDCLYIQTFQCSLLSHCLTAPPDITSLTFDPDSSTLTCTSTGSPATTVTWMKDGSPLVIDGTTYSMQLTVIGRSTSTYDNVLTISTTDSVVGVYTCTVENALGMDSTEIEVTGN